MKNKTAIVTGSTSGIGLAIAKKLAGEGVNIMLNGFGDIEQIEQLKQDLAKQFGVRVAYSGADLGVAEQIKQMVEQARQELGSVDILVNNAGVQYVAPVEEFPKEKWDLVLGVNLSGAFFAIQAALPIMKQNGFGRIINIASAHGLVASVNKAAYVAAKHGLVGLTKVVALENAKFDITCNAICPGWVLTPLVEKQIEALAAKDNISLQEANVKLVSDKHPSGRFVSPEDIGDTVLFLCSHAGRSITGTHLSVDGGWTAV
jgi:3-hydroxybutyrate dehydrogenase